MCVWSVPRAVRCGPWKDSGDLTSLSEVSKPDQPEISGEPGMVVAEKYQLQEVLGLGAMGTVWRAAHLGLSNQPVAVKLIAKSHATSREARKRFKVEATAAARLKSRFAVQVFDSGVTEDADELPYIVMEHLDGETLEELIDREAPLPLAETVRICAQVARGLSQAHEEGIIHRDLKPANIFLALSRDDESGSIAKVLDFGIAKLTDANQTNSATRTGTVLGTPQFMSPEQVRGLKGIDRRTDIYALGMVVYNMLTGTLAFEGDAFGDLLLRICTRDLPSICEHRPELPRELDEWFQRCCAREPQDRFFTAEEAADALLIASGLASELGSLSTLVAGTVASDIQGLRRSATMPPAAPHSQDQPTVKMVRSIPPLPPLPQIDPSGRGSSGTLKSSSFDVNGGPKSSTSWQWMVAAGAVFLLIGVIAWAVQSSRNTETAMQPAPSAAQSVAKASTTTANPPVKQVQAPPAAASAGNTDETPTPVDAEAPKPEPSPKKTKPKVPPGWKGFPKKNQPDPELGF